MGTIHYTRKLPDLAPVQAGATAQVQIPRGPTYRYVMLKYSANGVAANEATMKADIKRVSFKINGIERWSASATRIIDIVTRYYGESFTDGILFIPLSRANLATMAGIDNTAWGTANIDTLHMEVELNAGAVTPKLEAHAVVDPEARALGAIIEVHETQFSTAVAGVFEISTLVKSRGQLISMHCANANIDALEVAIDQTDFQNVDLDVLEVLYKRKPSERVPQAGYRHFDPVFLNRLADVLPMRAEDWRLKLDLSAAGSVGIFMETLNEPLGPSRSA